MNIKMTGNMKKISMILGASLLVLTAGCQKLGEGVNTDNTYTPEVEEGHEVELYATLPVTRTTLSSDFKLEWNENDVMAVFNAPTGTYGYSSNLKFAIDENAEGKFSPAEGVEVPFEDGVNYDWFVCTPWREANGAVELKTPKGQSKEDGYFPIGAATQNGYDNSDHISNSDIMVGKAINTRTPEITLKHLAVLHKFTVTNNSDKPTVITKLTFNGGDNKLFGTFWIDLTADEPAIDVNKANGAFNERALTVKNGTELAVGKSADFYVMTAPFTLKTGQTFKVTIETSTGTQVVEKTAPADIDFAAGTYNTASLVYNYVPVYADHLYYETFNTQTSLTDVSVTNSNVTVDRWAKYDKAGLTVYDGIVSNVNYINAKNSTISRYVSQTAIIGMDDLYADLNNGEITITGIKLHGYTKLNLSLFQTYKNSELLVEYSIDEGNTWTKIAEYVNPNTATCEERSTNFEIGENADIIWLKLTSTSRPRIDNIKLTWQAE